MRKPVIKSEMENDDYITQERIRRKMSIDEYMQMFGEPEYANRNSEIVALLKKAKKPPKSILELACACGFLALSVKGQFPKVKYTCTNISDVYLYYTKKQLTEIPDCEVLKVNADPVDSTDLDHIGLKRFDTVICTSLEHIEHDLDLVRKLPLGTRFYFSLNNLTIDCHFRAFHNESEIRAHYGGLLRFEEIVVQEPSFTFYIVSAVRVREKSHTVRPEA